MFPLRLRRSGAAVAGGRGAAVAGGRGAVVAAVAVTGLAAGCAHPVNVLRGHAVDITVSEYRLQPNDLVTSPGSVTLIVHNLGRLSHDVVVAKGGHSLASTRPIPPGGSGRLRLTLQVGRYTLDSSLGSDAALGIDGTLSVVRPG